MTRARDIADLAGGGTLLTRQLFTATAGQTTFTPSAGYNPGALEVFMNGLMLLASDYTATNSSTVVLGVAANAGDEVEILTYQINTIGDTVSASNGGTFNSDVIFDDNILVGKTTTALATAGITLGEAGFGSFTRSGFEPLNVNRLSSDGNLAVFYKDGTSVGSIQSRSNQFLTMEIGTLGTGITGTSSHAIIPSVSNNRSDNTNDLGSSVYRWKDAYIGGGIYLGGVGSANKLSSYEHGTWTPSFEGDTTAGTYTYVERQGHYVRVGNQVTAWVNLTNITTGTAGSGRIAITGLPYAANWMSGFNGESVGVIGLHGFAGINGLFIMPIIQDGLSKIFLYNFQGSTNTASVINVTDKTNSGSDIRGYVTYYIGG